MEFTDRERAYLREQRLARIATAAPTGQPDVAAVGFHFDGSVFTIGGYDITRTLKYQNARRNPHVALIVDDLETTQPWTPRGIKIHGRAEIVATPDGGAALRITPERKWSWGINQPAFGPSGPVLDRA